MCEGYMSLVHRVLNLLSRSRIDREIDDELRSHIEMRTADNIKEGMSPEDARRNALLRFGNRVTTKERVAAMDSALWLESVASDLRYTCRQLIKNYGFAITAIVMLTLGLGASVSIFSFVDAILIRPLPYQNPSRLVTLFESTPLGSRFHLSYLDYLDWKRMNHVFTSVEVYKGEPVALTTPTGVQRAEGIVAGAGLLRMLGVAPFLGRDFHPEEDTLNAPRTVILSYSAWQNRFGEAADILGKTVILDGVSTVVVGVLPRDFFFAPAGAAEFWMPIHASPKPEDRGEHGLLALARLKKSISLQVASAEMNAIAAQLAKQYPDADEGRGASIVPLTEFVVGDLRPTLWLLLSGAALLLLIACVNVSGLFLVRFESRQQELAVRSALGASPFRLIRQLTTEAMTLTVIAGVMSIAMAYGAVHLLRKLIPLNLRETLPYLAKLGLNAHVLLFAGAIAFLSFLLLSVIAILRSPLTRLRPGLTEGSRNSAGVVWRRLGTNLVVLELCIATILLAGAGLLCRSFYNLLHTPVGLEPDHLATLRLWAPPSKYSKAEQLITLVRRVMTDVSRMPGIQSVAVAHQIPIANVAGGNTAFEIIGRPAKQGGTEANSRQVSAGYFSTIRARLFRGRWFTESDDASKPYVAIVNRAFAQKYFAGEDPLGNAIRFDASQPSIRIVGVVDDLQEGALDSVVQPAVYTPFNQGADPVFFVVARTAQVPSSVLTSIEKTVHQIDPEILTIDSETMQDRIESLQSTYLHRSAAWLVAGFASVALLLGIVGVYGVIAYSVSQRTREIGMRMALGAQRRSVYRLILTEAAHLVVTGIICGLVGAIGAAKLMSNLLFGLKPWDGATLAGVCLVLGLAATLAAVIPARRAASIEPLEALRAE